MSLWKTLLKTAIYAPSPHNVQPWRVRILSDAPVPSPDQNTPGSNAYQADLLIEKHRTLPKEDPTGSFIILTMGLFIEALTLLAQNRSLRLDYVLYQQPSQFTPEHIAKSDHALLPFARLTLTPMERAREDPAFAIDDGLFMTRRTSRISLKPLPVPSGAQQALAKLASEWGQRYEQIADPPTIERILAKNTEALFDDLNAAGYHDEIVEWFRFTDRSAKRTRDGLDYRCMNSSRLSFWLAARWPQLLVLPIARSMLKKIYRRQLGLVPTVGMLAGPFWKSESAFETGRFLMRFWLELARHDLYIHPYGNLVTNKRAADWCHTETGVSDIWLIFKVGFSKEPPKSYRRSVEEVLVD